MILASTPSKRHARGVSALLHGGLAADAAVYLHPAESGVGMREIKAFCLGQLDFRMTVQGTPPETNEISHLAFTHRRTICRSTAGDPSPATRLRRAACRRAPPSAARGISSNLLISHVGVGTSGVYTRVARKEYGRRALAPAGGGPATGAGCSRSSVGVGARVDWMAGVSGAEVALDGPLYRLVAGPSPPSRARRRTSIRSTPQATSAIPSCRRASPLSGSARSAATSRRTG